MGDWIAAAAGLALLASGTPGVEVVVDQPPGWLKKPSAESLLGVWPDEAFKRAISGRAVISCKISRRGALFDCEVVSETPEKTGFGGAALALTPQLLMKPAMKGGAPVDYCCVRFPINFHAPSSPGRITASNLPLTQRVLSNPEWNAAPTLDDMAKAYPEKARTGRIGGLVTLSCNFSKSGTLRACATLREEPRGYGFAKAARELSGRFAAETTLPSGKSVSGANVQVLFAFTPEMLDGAIVASRPHLAATPDAAEFMQRFPQSAMKAGVLSASVVMACKVAEAGQLQACQVESEDPKGYEIGAATLPLASGFRMALWTEDGMPMVGARVRLPIRYAIEQAPEGASAAKP